MVNLFRLSILPIILYPMAVCMIRPKYHRKSRISIISWGIILLIAYQCSFFLVAEDLTYGVSTPAVDSEDLTYGVSAPAADSEDLTYDQYIIKLLFRFGTYMIVQALIFLYCIVANKDRKSPTLTIGLILIGIANLAACAILLCVFNDRMYDAHFSIAIANAVTCVCLLILEWINYDVERVTGITTIQDTSQTVLFCAHCGNPVSEQNRFCAKCGTPINHQ